MWSRRPRFNSNEELVDSLCRRETLRNKVVETAFRCVDRATFVESEDRESGYLDAPYRSRESELHLSAPHIYVTAAQALDLEPGLSFLNIGSGSGYFSAIVSTIIGPSAISHGIELKEELINFSRLATQKFLDSPLSNEVEMEKEEEEEEDSTKKRRRTSSSSSQSSVCAETMFFQGDVFLLNTSKNMKYDRIYVGAEAPRSSLHHFCELLNVNGILVGPFDGVFLRAKKSEDGTISTSSLAHVSFVPLTSTSSSSSSSEEHHNHDGDDESCFGEKEERTFVIASNRWNRGDHKNFPLCFRKCVTTFMIIVSMDNDDDQKLLPPVDVWTYVLEFLTPDWFEKPVCEITRLRKRLKAEIAAREDAENRAWKLQRERDQAMTMCMILQHRLDSHRRRHRNEDDDDGGSDSDVCDGGSDDDDSSSGCHNDGGDDDDDE